LHATMHARQPMHRVLSWIIAFGFTVGVLIYGLPCRVKATFSNLNFSPRSHEGHEVRENLWIFFLRDLRALCGESICTVHMALMR
jgi:hypothetical protein